MASFTSTRTISIMLFLLVPFARCEISNKKYPNYLNAKQDSGQELIHKVTLTQRGYIQFLKYIKDVPAISDFTFCIWLRSHNLTFNHPLFSYSKNENERYIRSWVGNKGREVSMSIMENEVFKVPILMRENHWHHICPSWNSKRSTWSLHVNGKLRDSGISPKLKDISIPKGGDIVVGQEYTDFDKGLDDGIEGDVYGFNLVLSPVISIKTPITQNYNLRRQYYAQTPSFYAQTTSIYTKTPSYTTSNPLRNYSPITHTVGEQDVVRYFKSDPVLRESKSLVDDTSPIEGYFEDSTAREGRGLMDVGRSMMQNFYNIMEPHHSHYQNPYYVRQQQPPRLAFSRPNGATKRIFNKPPNKNDLEYALPKSLGMKLVELSYTNCALGRGSPINDERVLISWTRTPVRVFGGAILKTIKPFCV